MKWFNPSAIMRGSGLCIAAAVLCAGSWCAAQDAASPADPWAGTTVYRDEWGVPHIYAASFQSLGYAFGYVQAEDHLDGMLKAYRVAGGRAAEVWGEAYAEPDKRALQMGHRELAQAALNSLEPAAQDLCNGFAMGVNAWIVEHPELVPAWADGVRPEDPLALLHCYLMSYAPVDLPGAYAPPAPSFSANAWAIAPKASATGETLLAINPHTYYTGPFQWYEAHLAAEGMDVYGATLFGLPVVLQGHNGRLGWALSPNGTDFADVFTLPIPEAAHLPGSVGGLQMSDEALMVWFMDRYARPYFVKTDTGLKKEFVPVVRMPEGPVIEIRSGRYQIHRIAGYGDFAALTQFLDMARAQDLAAFDAALAQRHVPCFDIVYAGKDGGIAYLFNSNAARRPAAAPAGSSELDRLLGETGSAASEPDAWERPQPAGDSRYAWEDPVPFAALPRIENPESGYVQACGSPPWFATAPSPLPEDSYPRWLASGRDTYRARRVRDLLGREARSFYDCQTMLYDTVASMAMDTVPWLLQVAQEEAEFVQSIHPDLAAGLEVLRAWNYAAETHSTGMTIYHLWWAALKARGLRMFPDEDSFFSALEKQDPALRQTLLDAAVDAVRLLRNEFQSLEVPWGKAHPVRRGNRSEPIAGAVSGEPVFLTSDQHYASREWPALYGYGFAMVVRFGETVEAVSVVPFGTSEREQSPHYADQLALLRDRQFKHTCYALADVQRRAVSAWGHSLTFRPAGARGEVAVESHAPIESSVSANLEPPAALPGGMSLFTSCITAKAARNSGATPHLALELSIPPEVCAPDAFATLALYAYSPASGWEPLAQQQSDPAAGVLRGWDTTLRTYAVLGPAAARQAAPAAPPAEPASVTVASTPRSVLVPASPEMQPPREAPADKPEPSDAPKTPVVVTNIPEKAEEYREEPPRTAMVTAEELEQALAASRASRPAAPRVSTEEVQQMTLGTSITLQPMGGGLFSITADQALGARLVYAGEAGNPPEGFVLFTPVIGIRATGSGAGAAALALSVYVAPEVCAAENLKDLSLYALDANGVWTPLDGQKLNTRTRSISAFDNQLRSYAVFGPAAKRTGAPPVPR